MEPHVWRDAEVTYPDYKGNAQLDFKKSTRLADFGIDEDKWLLIGFDLGGGEHSQEARVVLLDSALLAEENVNNVGELAEKLGYVPATEFLLHDVDPYELLKSISHMFEMRLRLRALEGHEIRITELSDIPEQ